MSGLAKASGAFKSVDYEVFGRVQGVCFRMYTEQEAKKLGVVGWVKNTSQGTVTGQVQGPEEKVNQIPSVILMTDEKKQILMDHFLQSVFGLWRFCILAVARFPGWSLNWLLTYTLKDEGPLRNRPIDVYEFWGFVFQYCERKSWLTKVGSPSSRIDKTNFSNEKEISKLDFSDFNTRY